MQSPPPPPSPPSPPKKLVLHYFDFPEVPSKKRSSGSRARRWRRQVRQPAASSEPQELQPQHNSESEGGEASHFQASNVSEKEYSCIEVLQKGLKDDDSKVEKSKETLLTYKSKPLVQKCQDVDYDTIESTFEHVISKAMADLSTDSKKKQKEKVIDHVPGPAPGVGIKIKLKGMPTPETEPSKTNVNESAEADETVNKSWNLRSRQQKKKTDEPKSPIIKEKGEKQKKEACPKDKGKKIADKEKNQPETNFKWPTFRLELTPEEIEEDLYAMTGGKRVTKRPKRRPKNVQKNIDLLALGKELEKITPKTYEVNEKSAQG